MHIVGTENDIDVASLLLDQLAVFLCQAPANHNLQVGFLRLQGLQVPERPIQLVVSILANTTRVEQDNIGVSLIVGWLISLRIQKSGNAF